jgi:hypothetical protein
MCTALLIGSKITDFDEGPPTEEDIPIIELDLEEEEGDIE